MECDQDVCTTPGYQDNENWTGTPNVSTGYNETEYMDYGQSRLIWTIISNILYIIICLVGIVGNALVIFVVARYTKMKTVTNMYILNLAVADLCFLIGLPFLVVTTIQQRWLFGFAMCKVFFILTSINWFTSVFTLTVMSADRYLAVCHPVRSMRYRTPKFSRAICIGVWTASILVMLPIVLYATTTDEDGHVSCTLKWPEDQIISPDKAFIWYALLLGFAIPVALIVVFYALVLIRLKTVGPKNKSKEKKRSHRKVSKLVLTVIAVYVICWLPYWVFQVTLTFMEGVMIPSWGRLMFQFFTVLSYANSMLNPVLYAFLSENFRKSFIKAFRCAAPHEVNGTLNAEQSTCHGGKTRSTTVGPNKHKMMKVPSEDADETEFTTVNKKEERTTQEATTMTVLSSVVNNEGYVVITAKNDTPA